MKKQNPLDKIDKYFQAQPKNVFALVLMLVVSALGYVVYDYSFDESEAYLSKETSSRDAAQNKLDDLNRYISQQENSKVVQNMKNNILSKQEKIRDLDADNAYFDGKLRDVSRVLNNQKNWSYFLDKAARSASKHNVTLVQLNSARNVVNSQQLQEAFSVDFLLQGGYHGILLFINDLERSLDVVDVKNINIFKPEYEKLLRSHNIAQGPNQFFQRYASLNFSELDKILQGHEVRAMISVAIWGIKY